MSVRVCVFEVLSCDGVNGFKDLTAKLYER
jgi:hypothetical protein